MSLKDEVNEILTNGFDFSSALHEDLDEEEFDHKRINTECVDHYGGEDQGSEYHTVYKFSKGNETVYVKFEGWYASHYGTEFREFNFVEPKEKLITVYE